MATYDLEGDRSGLPHTRRGNLAYEIDAFSYRRSHGQQGSAVQLKANQLWDDAPQWSIYMVGEVFVDVPAGVPRLSRQLPEFRLLRDQNLYCTALDHTTHSGTPLSGINHQDALEGFPATRRVEAAVTFESVLWDMLSDSSAEAYRLEGDVTTSGYGGVRELYRYMQRMQKAYSAEQRIPSLSAAGGFKIIDDAVSANRKPIGQVGFRTVSMADVVMKWMRVPLGWPPPRDWTPPGAPPFWPPRVNAFSTADPTKKVARDRFKGTVNQSWWDAGPIRGYAWEPYSLLYVGYDDSNQYWDGAGMLCCDYIFNFKFKEGGWNKFLSAAGNWVEVSSDISAGDGLGGTSAGKKPYEVNDFDKLFEYQA